MTELDPALECVRVDRDVDAVRVLVATITWDGPHTPLVEWDVFRELPVSAPENEIEGAVTHVLASPDYFATCSECGQRNPLGWMDDEKSVCQSCAQENHGVVY